MQAQEAATTAAFENMQLRVRPPPTHASASGVLTFDACPHSVLTLSSLVTLLRKPSQSADAEFRPSADLDPWPHPCGASASSLRATIITASPGRYRLGPQPAERLASASAPVPPFSLQPVIYISSGAHSLVLLPPRRAVPARRATARPTSAAAAALTMWSSSVRCARPSAAPSGGRSRTAPPTTCWPRS